MIIEHYCLCKDYAKIYVKFIRFLVAIVFIEIYYGRLKTTIKENHMETIKTEWEDIINILKGVK